MRRGWRLWLRESIRPEAFSGVVYVFRAKRAVRVKLIFWDVSGVVLVAKRPENSPRGPGWNLLG